jgi:hypothetical protein
MALVLEYNDSGSLTASATGSAGIFVMPANVFRATFDIDLVNIDAVGTLKIQESGDGVNWKDVGFVDRAGTGYDEYAVAAGTDVHQGFVFETGSQYVRLLYTRTGGGAAQSFAWILFRRMY